MLSHRRRDKFSKIAGMNSNITGKQYNRKARHAGSRTGTNLKMCVCVWGGGTDPQNAGKKFWSCPYTFWL